MAYGVLIESMIQAKNIDALNRSVKAEADVAGGGLLALTAPATQGDDVWTAEAPDSELGGLWIAYNPEVKYIKVNGKKFAGLSADARDYTNLAGEVFDAFKPQIGDEIVITAECVASADVDDVVAGDFLEAVDGETTFARVAAGTGATAGSTAFKVEWVGSVDFPKANIGIDKVKAFKAVCVQE
jgi:hypothetical protein